MKILISQLYRIGDVLLTTPLLREIKKSFPDAEVDFLAENPAAEILIGNPAIHEVLIYDKNHPWKMIKTIRSRHYDWVVDLLGTPRTAILTALSGAKIRAGLNRVFHSWAYNHKLIDPEGPLYVAEEKIRLLQPLGVKFTGDLRSEIKIPKASQLWAENFFKSHPDLKRPLIALSPVSRRHFRRWPPSHYAALADRLIAELNCAVLIIWGPGEEEMASAVSGQMTHAPVITPAIKNLLDLAAILKRTDLFLGNDNGVKHIAAAVGKPTFTLYGNNLPINWTHPDSKIHRFIQNPTPERDNNPKRLDAAQTPGLTAISVDDVFDRVKIFLADISKNPTHLVK